MKFLKIDELKKVVGWSHKCGSTSVVKNLIIEISKLYNFDLEINNPHRNLYSICKKYNLKLNYIKDAPEDYTYELYVRDPYHRLISCFLNKPHLLNKNITFKYFVFNLKHLKGVDIKSHIIPQSQNFFEANWNVYDIEKSDLGIKLNRSKYNLGYKKDAWDIPLNSLFWKNGTFSKESFYSKEIYEEIRRAYEKDYELLSKFKIQTLEL